MPSIRHKRHREMVHKIVAYLKGNQGSGNCVPARSLKLSLFIDAGYGDRCNDRQSVWVLWLCAEIQP